MEQRKNQLQRRQLLDLQKKETMLAILIRNLAAFEDARETLTEAHVDTIGPGHALVWRLVGEFFDAHGELPPSSILVSELHNAIPVVQLMPEELQAVDDFVAYAFGESEQNEQLGEDFSQSIYRDYALATLQQFLEELTAGEIAKNLSTDASVPADLPAILQSAYEQSAKLASMASVDDESVFGDDWEADTTGVIISTGVSILDHFLGGGHSPGEVNTFKGPIGSCKTTICCQSCVETARMCRVLEAAGHDFLGRPLDGAVPQVIYVSTEMPRKEFRQRMLIYGAGILASRIRSMQNGLEDLSNDPDNPLDYEVKRYRREIEAGRFVPERERARRLIRLINRYVWFIDFTPSNSKNPTAGGGGVAELARIIRASMRKAAIRPVCLILDHASAMADRILENNEHLKREDRPDVLKNIPRQLRDQLAGPLDIPILCIHQLNSDSNSKKPSYVPDYTDGEGAKLFDMYADHAIMVGRMTDDQVAACKIGKHRREPPRRVGFIKLDGAFARVRNCSAHYQFVGRTIAKVSEAAGLGIANAEAVTDGSGFNDQ